MDSSDPVEGPSGKSLFIPQPLFLRVLQGGGACRDTFTYDQVLFYLGEYIKAKGLFDKIQPHIVCCSNDLLGDVFGASSFSMSEHRKLCAMISRNLIEVDLSESTSPFGSREETRNLYELESEHQELVQELWEEYPSPSVGTTPPNSERSSSESEDGMDELPCTQPRSQAMSESSLPLSSDGCGVLGGTGPGQNSPGPSGSITSTSEPVQEPGEEHPPPIVDTGLATSGRPCEAEDSSDESPCGQLRKRKKSDSSVSLLFDDCDICSVLCPGQENDLEAFSSSPESVQEDWEEHLFPSVDIIPSASSGRPPSETEASVEEMPCGKAGNPEEAKSSITYPSGRYSVHSLSPISEAYPSSQEPVQEPGEEHPHPPLWTLDWLLLEDHVKQKTMWMSRVHRETADSASDRFSVEYDVDSLDSEDFAINPQQEELTLEGACAEGDPAQPQQLSSSGIDWEPGPSHAQTGGRPAQGSNPQEPPEQAVLAPCSQGASGDSPPAPFQVGTRHSMNFQEPCILCLSEPKDCCMVHGVTGHVVTCFMCASKLRQRRKPCPVCRLPIDHIIFIYLL
ncbi:E3 ubiquitin-protein ligase Mdm2-like [Dromiciops gliroides]|uniref:E3 ubiquitin-protein ligase Mdm2-like n=1 Tax=Dromiciops gliroides TaxID=33562 RepID=UPI001CC4EEA7|nr:E3 ubiquitin-protein ligase Mdm2-like [Dromiciops gliroides]